jgi:NhaP-type Na+/H+ or K+/H+ antiporter
MSDAIVIEPVVLIASAVVAYALVSRRLATTIVTAPIFFVAVGLLAGPVLGIVDLAPDDEGLVLLLEAALVMVLFADASGLDLRRFSREPSLAGRLLGIGLPLTMVAGAIAGAIVFPEAALWQVALIGVILAPTDAALGQAVVANPRVPAIIRNALNVESGLNDGLALPFVSILVTVGLVSSGAESEVTAVEVLVRALLGSTAIGLAVGSVGGGLLRAAARRGLASEVWQPIVLVALALLAFVIADEAEASGFLAAWVAGLVTGHLIRGSVPNETFHLPEQLADALAALGFLMLGLAMLEPVVGRVTPQTIVYAVLSLTVVRLLPVALAMWRTGFARPTVLYVGWFGPRGLASIVFASVVVTAAVPDASVIADAVLLTVAISLLVHGVTAAWGARRYATWFERAVAADPAIAEAASAPAPTGRRMRAAADVAEPAGSPPGG